MRQGGRDEAVTTYQGKKTQVVIDKEKGTITVYDAKDGSILYSLTVSPCGRS